ncbi:MAG: sulfatase-like hydrolase/transferase [Myxococcales bacterium]|nr:sulfatase-like hydrolase/transferase [Myxococcales bacterium]
MIALAWLGCAAPPSPVHHPNVLVVVWDTVRADHTSLLGYARPTTPRLAAFAERGAVFEQARSAGIWTLPSHASMFTGLPPETHGAGERWLWLDDRHQTLAEQLDAAGYDTISAAANALLCNETHLVQGFDVVANTWKGRVAPRARAATLAKILPEDRSQELSSLWRPPEHGAHNAEWDRAVYKDAAPLLVSELLSWVDRRPEGRPWFAFVNLMEAHTPRVPTLASRRAVMADDPDLIELGLRTDAAHIRLHFYNFGQQEYSDREIEAIRGVYDATLRDLDDATGQLVDGLASRGLLEDTVVVVVADHGENLGDHHLFNHRFGLWDSLAHVPLVVVGPGVTPGRHPEPVSTMDLFGTVARLAKVDVPEGLGDWFERPSPVVTTMADPLRREIEVVRAVHPEVQVEPWLRSGHAIAEGGQKLIRWSDGEEQRYDVVADPDELTALPGPHDPLAPDLSRWQAAVRPYDPAERGPRDQPAHVRASQQELRSQLEALGYTAPDE